MRGIRISTREASQFTSVQLRIDHPMENGRRQDALGNKIPAWYLTRLHLMLNEQTLSVIELGSHISRNPAFSFAIRELEPGDEIVVKWFDNRQESGEHKKIVK